MSSSPSTGPTRGAPPAAEHGAHSAIELGSFADAEASRLQTEPARIPPWRAEALNRWLLHQLEDDQRRSDLYARLQSTTWKGTLNFPSRSALDLDPAPAFEPPALHDHEVVTLIANRPDIEAVLVNADGAFSNRTYRALGAGNFMLGLDPVSDPAAPQSRLHRAQHDAASVVQDPAQVSRTPQGVQLAPPGMRLASGINDRLIALALEAAATTGLAQRHFDLADHAQEVALRYAGLLFGFAASDHALLREALMRAYRGLSYQMLGRHFVGEPDTLPQSREKLALLASRCDALIRRYAELKSFPEEPPPPWTLHPDRHLWPEGVDPVQRLGLTGFTPLLKAWAETPSPLSGQQLATMAVGMLAGIVGNVQASVCIAVEALLAPKAARSQDLAADIGRALTRHPPAPFLPRFTEREVRLPSGRVLPPNRQCILALGAATLAAADAPARARGGPPVDPMVFGLLPGPDRAHGLHWCLGAYVIWPLVEAAVQQVLLLPGLAQRIDPVDGQPLQLEKRWGFACVRQPLEYRRDRCRVQQPLQVIMRIKTPVAANAERLRQIIRNGAPKIERALREARHVHFAWFQLVDDETHLALQTIYDGEFDAYIQHFALKVDDVFDQLFEFIEGAPPLPVGQHPEAFVETIRRYNRAPLGGYFFSAYPQLEVWNLTRGRGPGTERRP